MIEVGKMKELKRKTGGTCSYQQIISEFSVTKVETKKVTILVGTFLKEASTISLLKGKIYYGCKKIISMPVQVPASKMASEKVPNTVGTFLNEAAIKRETSVMQDVIL